MNTWKRICSKLLFLPLWLIILMTVVSAALLTVVFVAKFDTTPIAYVVYVLSAYTLTVLCIFFAKTFPGYYKSIKQKVYDHPIGNRYMSDATFRVRVSLYGSLAITLLYSVFKLITGIWVASYWWASVAGYYILLSLLRFVLLRFMNSGKQGALYEYRRYRLCGILMLILNLCLSGIATLMVLQNKGYSYPGLLIFVAAAFTFYMVTLSIVDLIKYRKYHSPVMSAAKMIQFAAALVSLLSLETAMLSQFGGEQNFSYLMTALTGAGVCAVVLGMSVYMIVHASLQIKKMQINNS